MKQIFAIQYLLKTVSFLSLQSRSGIGCVAQLDRAPDYGSGGLGFESLRDHKNKKDLANFAKSFLFLLQ